MLVRIAALLFALIPAAAAAASPLRIGSDISYAPLEFYQAHSKDVKGLDFDLAAALAAQLGKGMRFRNHDFNDLLAAVRARTLDLAISAISDTRKRARQVDFVDYFLAGSGILVQAGNPHHIFNVAGLCGMSVDLQRGTSQETAVQAQSRKCTAVGLKAVDIRAYATDDEAFGHFQSGETVAHISDYPVIVYLARTLGGGKKYALVGSQFNVAPYGIAVSKNNHRLRDRIQSALKAIIANGEYDKLLRKWGLEQGAMRSAPINAGTKFE